MKLAIKMKRVRFDRSCYGLFLGVKYIAFEGRQLQFWENCCSLFNWFQISISCSQRHFNKVETKFL